MLLVVVGLVTSALNLNYELKDLFFNVFTMIKLADITWVTLWLVILANH